jgi:hypothetical protein
MQVVLPYFPGAEGCRDDLAQRAGIQALKAQVGR